VVDPREDPRVEARIGVLEEEWASMELGKVDEVAAVMGQQRSEAE